MYGAFGKCSKRMEKGLVLLFLMTISDFWFGGRISPYHVLVNQFPEVVSVFIGGSVHSFYKTFDRVKHFPRDLFRPSA